MSDPTHDEWKRLVLERATATAREFSGDVLDPHPKEVLDLSARDQDSDAIREADDNGTRDVLHRCPEAGDSKQDEQ